jgi:Cu(I)/Ag(I) efflux system membrane fusion protein
MKAKEYLTVIPIAALVLVVVALLVQHRRHGWPFSLHHGVGAQAAGPAAYPSPEAAPASAAEHLRTGVELVPGQAAAIGLRVVAVQEETITESLRAVATVVPDESRVSHVHTRVAGWIERLHVNTTGENVAAGQPLAEIFSQELLSSQAEFLAARRAATTGESLVLAGARSRLTVLGMAEEDIRGIEQSGEPRRLVTVTAPRSGVVVHRGISVGTAVDPSTELVTIADLSQVWVIAEVAEADIPKVAVGSIARLEFPAAGMTAFEAPVEFLYPTLSERTRTLRVRFALANPRQALRPGIYGNATFQLRPRPALTLPRDAIVDTGRTQHVFVAESEQRFVPRPVKLGARFGERVEVREGLSPGEQVAATGVFLLDSESRLRASGGGTGHDHGAAAPKATAPKSEPGHAGH